MLLRMENILDLMKRDAYWELRREINKLLWQVVSFFCGEEVVHLRSC
jgi:hypothetical protein